MAAMSTAMTEFQDNGNSRTWVLNAHTAVKPRLVIQKRSVPTGPTGNLQNSIAVIYATEDSAGALLNSKVALEVSIRYPKEMGPSETDLTDAAVVLKDIVASDEFAATLASQKWLKA